MGTPLAIFIEKDVSDRDQLVEIITVSPEPAHDIRRVREGTLTVLVARNTVGPSRLGTVVFHTY